jgi:hypothetical protein
MGILYDTDIVAWASEQAELIRARKWDALDLEHIAEEIEDVGKSEKRELRSRLAVLTGHLLKWEYQPDKRGKSWMTTIEAQRESLALLLKAAPSLKHLLLDEELIKLVWSDARALASGETGIHDISRQPLWDIDAILDKDFFPD